MGYKDEPKTNKPCGFHHRKPNIFDNMLSIMEKYACNLEDLVQERTFQLIEEKKKTDALLHRMLPKYEVFHSSYE